MATLAATAVAVAAVGGVARSVVDEPGPTFPPAALAPSAATSSGATGAITPSPSEPPTTGVATTSSAVPSSTTAPATSQSTYRLDGGSVTLIHGPGLVRLAGANPAAGYTAEVESAGPDRVEVEFEAASGESKFRADATDGDPAIRIDESDDDD